MSRRTKPYTTAGIRRLLCVRCKINRASVQWQICADDSIYRPLCSECDLKLNRMVLVFMKFQGIRDKMKKYAAARAIFDVTIRRGR